jgi:hypothetical protein
MTILEIMERTNTRDTKLIIAFIKDAIMKAQSTTDMSTKVSKQNIIVSVDGDDNQYDLPVDMIAVHTISVLDTEDGNKYKSIRRLANEPLVTEDTSP